MNAGKRIFVLGLFVILAVYYYPLRYQSVHFLLSQLHLHGGAFLFFLAILSWGKVVYKLFFKRLNIPSLWVRSQVYLVLGFLLTGQVFIFLRLFESLQWPLVWIGFLSWPVLSLTLALLRMAKTGLPLHLLSRLKILCQVYPGETFLSMLFVLWFLLFIASGQFPPVSYDGLSYHLAIPHWWLREGFVADHSMNLYSAMPFHWQSIYALFSLISGASGQYLHIITGLLGIINIGYVLLLFIKVPRIPALLCCLFILSLPEYFYLSQQANIDLGLFFTLSVLMLIAWNPQKEVRRSWVGFWIVAFLIGTKYTAILLYAIPFLAADLFLHKRPIRTITGGAVILALQIPHAIKNLILYQNPVYPLFGFLGSERYYDYSFFLTHHTPNVHDLFRTDILLRPAFLFPMILVSIIFFVQRRYDMSDESRYRCVFALIFSILSWIFFCVFTVGTTRFIFPLWAVVLPLTVHIIPLDTVMTRRCFRVPLFLFIILSFYWQTAFLFSLHPNPVSYFVGINDRQAVLEKQLPGYGSAVSFINEELHSSSILFIGEARTYYLKNPGNITYNTVFNYNPAALLASESPDYESFISLMRKQEWDYVLVNEMELNRLQSFYGDIWHYCTREGRERWELFLQYLSEKDRIFEYIPHEGALSIYIVPLTANE